MRYLVGALLVVVCFFLTVSPCNCWTQDELDLFDLVEEIGLDQNFYSLMHIEKDATSAEVRRAYRQLSLQLHPDKSEDPDAAENFRKMVAVAEVLRDEVKREMYDQVLVEGLPDWKQPLFYYRRMRKMGLLELGFLLLLMASVAHYLYGWAVFAEKQIVLQDMLTRKQKKDQRKSKRGTKALKLDAEVERLTTQAQDSIPHLKNLLPMILAKSLVSLFLLCWSLLGQKLGGRASAPTPSEAGEGEGEESRQSRKYSKFGKTRNYSSSLRSDGNKAVEEEKEGEEEEGMERESRTRAGKGALNLSGRDEGRREEEEENGGEEWREGESAGKRELKLGVGEMESESVSSHKEGEEIHRCSKLGVVSNGVTRNSKTDLVGKTKQSRPLLSGQDSKNDGRRNPLPMPKGKENIEHAADVTIWSGRAKCSMLDSTTVSAGSHIRARNNNSTQKSAHNLNKFQLKTIHGTDSLDKSLSRHSVTIARSPHVIGNGVSGTGGTSVDGDTGISVTDHTKLSLSDTAHTANAKDGRCSLNGDIEAGCSLNGDSESSSSVAWSQYQQKQLEWALTKYPKFSAERWLNVAKAVPGKTQEECIVRCKQLYEEVKKKKAAQAALA